MRYYLNPHTLFVRGAFRAASTGVSGGIRSVFTLLNHTVPAGWSHDEPEKDLELVIAGAGIGNEYFGLLTAVPVQRTCVLQYDFVTVFVTAGIHDGPSETAGTINIIVTSSEGMEDAALLETIMVATEAKAGALIAAGHTTTGTPTDAVIVACESAVTHQYAGRQTEIGRRVYEAVKRGIPEALARTAGSRGASATPAFFVFSRFKGEHWVEWTPDNCQYYPCHFPGQRCDFCYCPYYPCLDKGLGQWTTGSNGGRVWNCAGCTLLHEPRVAEYLRRYPESSREELVRLSHKKAV
jgi:adenosylcobinamide hydrolase